MFEGGQWIIEFAKTKCFDRVQILTEFLTKSKADDFVTANIYEQSGGLDASIGFETSRAENVGPAFADSLTFFSYFFNQKVSSKLLLSYHSCTQTDCNVVSDLIALGTVMATSACGGPHVEFRAGRVDATLAGPSGEICSDLPCLWPMMGKTFVAEPC